MGSEEEGEEVAVSAAEVVVRGKVRLPSPSTFSLTTIQPLGRSEGMRRERYAVSCSSVRWPRHHWFQMRS